MKFKTVLSSFFRCGAFGVAVVLTSCALESSAEQKTVTEKQYVTGSNIPRDTSKTDVKTVSVERNEISRPQVLMPLKQKTGN